MDADGTKKINKETRNAGEMALKQHFMVSWIPY